MLLGVIPARGGSKTIPRKNLHPLNGKPLIDYTIEAAYASKLDDVVISSDDPAIIRRYKKVNKRPQALAGDSTPMINVIIHTVRMYEDLMGLEVDAVMTLQPTSPLRTAEDIDTCIGLFEQPVPSHIRLVDVPERHYDSLVSVIWGVHPIKSYRLEEGNELEPFVPQEEPYDKHKHKCLTRNGAIFITRRDLLDSGRLIGDSPLFYVMPKSRSIDIDDYEDLLIAEALLQKGELQ